MVLAPLAVGGVYIVAYSAIEILAFGMLIVHVLLSREGFRLNRAAVSIPFFFFLLIAVIQMIPLPLSVLNALSPSTYGLYERLGMLLPTAAGAVTTAGEPAVSAAAQALPIARGPNLPLSLSVYATSTAFLKWASYLALFLVIIAHRPGHTVLKGTRWLVILLLAIVFVGFAEGAYGLWAYVNNPAMLLWFTRTYGGYSDRVAGTYVNPNHLAGLMNMTIPLAIAFLAYFTRSARKRGEGFRQTVIAMAVSRKAVGVYLLLFAIVIMILALIFSASRMGHFGFITGSVVIGLLFLFRRPPKGRARAASSPFLVLLMLCLAAAILWGGWKGLDPVIERWDVANEELMKGRGILWETTKQLIADFPLTGTGLGTFELAYPRYQPPVFGATLYDHAHNDYLQILAETGWPGFVFWLSFYLFFLVRVIIGWFANHEPFAVAVGAGGIGATVAILVHSAGEFNLQIPANAMLLFIVMAVTWRSVVRPWSSES